MALRGVIGLVTGAASGLGRATAERIVRQGGSVVLADLPMVHPTANSPARTLAELESDARCWMASSLTAHTSGLGRGFSLVPSEHK
jgi:NAD(P)-dependent dehydrogenase (short-subunit alcohol dehydrogenase family)